MSSFFEFIEKDIDAKKKLLSCMPLNTKTNEKKYVQKIDLISSSYINYKDAVLKYISAKKDKLDISSSKNDLESMEKELENLKEVVNVLNPINTYVEKIGLDDILYELTNYDEFSFERNVKIINDFISKFESSGINLTVDDFNITFYVGEFMESLLNLRKSKTNNCEELKKVFEKIYWNDPKIMEHIELNFRQLIHRYKKELEQYISERQGKMMVDNDASNYKEALKKYNDLYDKIALAKNEDIHDIIEKAKTGMIEIKNYFPDSKLRTTAYESLSYKPLTDENDFQKFYESLVRLKSNLVEYRNYSSFMDAYEIFKKEDNVDKKTKNDELKKTIKNETTGISVKNIKDKIDKLETQLEKINRKLSVCNSKSPFSFIKRNSFESKKEAKFQANHLADELYDLYVEYDKKIVLDLIEPLNKKSMLLFDVIFIINSFNYFRKSLLKKAYKLETYDDVVKKDEIFRTFANNPNNIICKSIYFYEQSDVVDNIVTKYRFENIKLVPEELNIESIDALINKIDFLLRIKKIESSKTTVSDIWFIVESEKLLKNN